jgi:protein-tyrosine phosphatase
LIDIHSHILPGLDDGSQSLENSIEMLRMASAAGTTDIVATPHANSEFAFRQDEVEAKIVELRQAAGDTPRIHYGCDFHLTPENIEESLRSPGKYSINHQGYLMVEFADTFIPKATADIFGRMLSVGLYPVVTHPERNALLQKKLPDLEAWVEMGCYLQVTAQSVLGGFGRHAKEFSEILLSRGLVHFLASDAHDVKHRTTVLNPAWEYVENQFGSDTARLLLEENPGRALVGDPLPVQCVAPRRKRWFFLGRGEGSRSLPV